MRGEGETRWSIKRKRETRYEWIKTPGIMVTNSEDVLHFLLPLPSSLFSTHTSSSYYSSLGCLTLAIPPSDVASECRLFSFR